MNIHEMVVTSLKQWINKNIHGPLKISDVVIKSGYSHWYLQRLFFRIENQTLGSYIRNIRLEHAREDVLKGNESLQDIAFKYGYDSQQTFSRLFAKKFRLPPAKYRKEIISLKEQL